MEVLIFSCSPGTDMEPWTLKTSTGLAGSSWGFCPPGMLLQDMDLPARGAQPEVGSGLTLTSQQSLAASCLDSSLVRWRARVRSALSLDSAALVGTRHLRRFTRKACASLSGGLRMNFFISHVAAVHEDMER